MLRIQDKTGKTKFILRDDDEEPVEVEELVLNDEIEEEGEGESNANKQDGD